MTETTKSIFEKYQIRKSRKQKTAFVNWLKPIIENSGYEVKVEKGLFGARNIVVGNPNTAKVVYTAHYDTCATLPFPNFITPKCFLVYLLYQIALVLAATALVFALTIVLYLIKVPYVPQIINIVLWLLIALMLFGPANKHTVNDNTSGITVLINTINTMPAEIRNNAAFIFFDLEEAGLIGSLSYRLKHNKTIKKKLLINFDCVSDGNNFLFTVKRKAKCFVPIIKQAFQNNKEMSVEVVSKGVFYPSDQALYPYGVGVAALNRTKFLKILYMNRIHTKRDNIYQENNINFLVNGAVLLLKNIIRKETENDRLQN